MAVREFNGSTDLIDLSVGSVSTTNKNNTVLFLCRFLAVEEAWLIIVRDTVAGFNAWGVNPYSDGRVYGSGGSLPYSPSDGWVIVGFSKQDNGIAGQQPVVWHYYRFDTHAWTHTALGLHSEADYAPNVVRIGNDDNASRALNGRLAVIGQWNAVLTNTQVETLGSSLANWSKLNPAALWAFNQTSTSEPVTDLTENGADQIGISGTAVVFGDDPPGFDFGGPAWTYGYEVRIG